MNSWSTPSISEGGRKGGREVVLASILLLGVLGVLLRARISLNLLTTYRRHVLNIRTSSMTDPDVHLTSAAVHVPTLWACCWDRTDGSWNVKTSEFRGYPGIKIDMLGFIGLLISAWLAYG